MVSKKKLSRKLYMKHKSRTLTKYKSRTLQNTPNAITIKLNKDQAELILLYKIIITHILLMLNNKVPKKLIKETMMNLFKKIRTHNKFISKDVSDDSLEKFFNLQYNKTKEIKIYIYNTLKYQQDQHIKKIQTKSKHTSRHTSRLSGGFYFKNLEEKGDEPLTGNDLATLLDEMQSFFYNAKYTEEGKFLQDTDALVSMFRGDVSQFKGLLQYRIFPKYYSIFPPFLNFANIKKDLIDQRRWEDIPDYLLAYQTYLHSRDEYLVNKGLKSPDVLNKDLYKGFYNKLANSLDQSMQKLNMARMTSQGQLNLLTV